MPFYEYQCGNCGHVHEAMQKITDAPLRKCPDCGRLALKKLLSAPVFRLKGSGWYETDFKSDTDKKRNLVEEVKEEKKDEEGRKEARGEAEGRRETQGEGRGKGKAGAKDPQGPQIAMFDARRVAGLAAAEGERFAADHPGSASHAVRLAAHWLNGVPMHWMRDWGTPFPLVVRAAQGAIPTDVDGHHFTDFVSATPARCSAIRRRRWQEPSPRRRAAASR